MKKIDTTKRILLASTLKHTLTKEFEVSMVSVNNALNGTTGSYLAKHIRKRARELMQHEINKIQE